MTSAPPAPGILSPEEMGLLGRLELVHRSPARGPNAGPRRSSHTARSPELADFRPYVHGDDVRQIDWRAYARLERLMLRLYVAEEESALNVVVDAGASMGLGTPSKWPPVRRLAAALALLGLAGGDRVAVGTLDRRGPFTPHLRRSGGTRRLLDFLADLEPTDHKPGSSERSGASEAIPALTWMRPGVTVVVSDFLTEAPWRPAILAMGRGKQEPLLWQVLAPDEERPSLRGDLRLRDAESGRIREVTVTPRVVAGYREALEAHREGLRREASGAGGRFVHTSSDDDLETMMQAGLSAGALRRP